MGIELVHWNPRKPVIPSPIGRLLPFGRRYNNFGDLLGPMIVRGILEKRGLHLDDSTREARLLSIGSILHLARPGDVVWGSGINGKVLASMKPLTRLDIRAVRGPLTRGILVDWGLTVPEVFGDPALLLGTLWSRSAFVRSEYKSELLIVPNFNDVPDFKLSSNVLDPRSDLFQCLCRIASADMVIGTSLHGIVVAEALGVPARLIASPREHTLKYEDYYLGSGRRRLEVARNISHALDLGGETPPEWDPMPLLRAFPGDLWASDDSVCS